MVELRRIPVAPALLSLDGADPVGLALNGGEDYELLVTMPAWAVEPAAEKLKERFGTPLTDIGEIREGDSLTITDDAGEEHPLEAKGWDHFA